MKELLDKLSSYNIFNYLLPGILFSVLVSKMTELELIQKDLVVGVFVYYFIGLIVSRFGSLIFEPLLKKLKFLKFADYKDFVQASSKDEKIEILSEANNMYRTFIATFILLGLVKLYYLIANKWTFINENSDWILILLIAGRFLFSYRKQTNYITKRINSQKTSNE
jgi:hypothetical protein